MEMEFFQLIGNYGFPMVLTIYLLVRFEGKIDGLKGSIDNLSDKVGDLKNNE